MVHLQSVSDHVLRYAVARKPTHADYVAVDVAAVRQVSGDGDKNVDCTGSPVACSHHAGCPEMRIVLDFIQNRKHLPLLSQVARDCERPRPTYVLMASIREYNDGKAGQSRHGSGPLDHSHFATVRKRVAFNEVGYY